MGDSASPKRRSERTPHTPDLRNPLVWTSRIDLRAGLVIVLLSTMLAGCMKAGSGAPQQQEALLARLLSEGATQADLERQLGKPTAVYASQATGREKVSWAYAYTQLGAHPARYIPFLGAYAVASVEAVEPSSFAVNFSEEGIVEGFTQRRLARYTIDAVPQAMKEPVTLYGERNLMSRPGPAILEPN